MRGSDAPMRPFVHPLGLFVLLAGAITALLVEDRAGWSGRAPWIAAWTFAGYAALVVAQLIPGRRSSKVETLSQVIPSPASPPETPGSAPAEADSPGMAGGNDDAGLHMQESLRRLNNPAALGDSALAHRLPKTIAAFSESLADHTTERTAL